MRAGDLNVRMAFQRATFAPDATGQPIPTWAALFTASVALEPLSGTERLAAQQIRATAAYRIRLRARRDVALLPADRGVWGARIFDVLCVLNVDTQSEEWRLAAAEVIA